MRLPFTLSLIFPRLLLAAVAAFGFATAAAPSLAAQGVLIPRCGPDQDCVAPRLPTWGSQISRGASRVRVALADRVLHYEVDETFINHGGRVGEADYIFPLPKNAAFADLQLSINGQLVSGETMDAQHARGIYEETVRRLRDPALVEWMGYGMLRTRIFPIQPGEEKRVVIRFDQVAPREGDALRIDYVRGSPPERAPLPLVRPVSTPSEDGESRSTFVLTYPASAAYGRPYSPTHALDVSTEGAERRVGVLGDAREVVMLIPVRRSSDVAAVSVLANNTGREDGFALITLTPPAALRATSPRDVTFVLDVSGSMSGAKIEQARAAGRQLLGTLGPRDRFRLIDFSTDVRTFRDNFVAATPETIRAAERYIDALTASGGTNIAGALDEALRYPEVDARRDSADRLPLVLFITDGEPTVGERRPDAIATAAARSRGRARVFTFGLGADVNATLLEQLAIEGRGTASFVRPSEDVERAVSLVASRLTNPVATDVRVRADGVRLGKLLPGGPIDVFAGQDMIVLARYSGSGHATLHFDGNALAGPVHWTQQVDFPAQERGNAFVPRLWATQRVGYLSAERRKNGGNPELDDEIRSLGERFGIPTELTSYLVQEPSVTSFARGGVNQLNEVVVTGTMASPAAPRERAFEAAKQATALRGATSLAASDAATDVGVTNAANGTRRRIGDRVFTLVNSIWTDMQTRASAPTNGQRSTIRVQPFSEAYFKLLDIVPELKPVFALGDRILVAGRRVVVEVAPDGVTTLSEGDVQALRSGW